MIRQSEWKWFGHPAHFIGSRNCRFHLATVIGEHMVSTVGDYYPASLDGPVDIGCNRKFETMVFALTGTVCESSDCECELPDINPQELDMRGYQTAGDAAAGHMAICMEWATK